MKPKAVQRFTSRMVAGCLLSVIAGSYLDEKMHTTPWIMLVLLVYVIGGSLYLLVKDSEE